MTTPTIDIAAIREWATCNQQRIKNGRMGSSEAYDSVIFMCDARMGDVINSGYGDGNGDGDGDGYGY